jgi:hypothetical protein
MSWIKLLGDPREDLVQQVREQVRTKVETGVFKQTDVDYLQAHRLPQLGEVLLATPDQLERLRELARCWDVRLQPPRITSHRKFIGPVIVAFKKLLFRVLAVLLKEQLARQRDFNAKTVELFIATYSNKNA